ncbi:MAG TPA: GNAT family N-acetyltransferase [Cyclobacteriaceae bacterium]|nr:GNAT family N-acetyltransferase [Cyclobacteriaceae bacterium]
MYIITATARLNIRPINLADAAFMYTLLNSDGWLRFIGNRNINSLADAELYIQHILDKPDAFYNIVELKSERKAIGLVTLMKRDNQKFMDIGFALLPDYEKKGYAIEASRKYLAELLKLQVYENIIGISMSSNTKSIKVLEKLGLSFQSSFTDKNQELHLYALHK